MKSLKNVDEYGIPMLISMFYLYINKYVEVVSVVQILYTDYFCVIFVFYPFYTEL